MRNDELFIELKNGEYYFQGKKLNEANLSGAYLKGAKLIGAYLKGAKLIGADLRGADLRGADLKKANLNKANLSEADLRGADLKKANLSEADLSQADLSETELSGAILHGANFFEADLFRANLSEAHLEGASLSRADLRGADLSGANLTEANLIGADFREANLTEANLIGAHLKGADLSRANLIGADLSGANLTRIQALGTNFIKVTLTGACLEDWNINNDTQLDNINCQYVYLKDNQQNRRPSSGVFKDGDFTKLFQKALETVDLIFSDSIDWNAFFLSFKDLQVQYAEDNLSVQAIEKKSGGAFIIRVEVSPKIDKAECEEYFKVFYENKCKILEAELKGKNELIKTYENNNANMMTVIKILASHSQQQQPIIINNNLEATAMAESQSESNQIQNNLQGANIGNFANQVQDNARQQTNQYNYTSPENQILVEVVAEIQKILKQLEQSYSTNTIPEKMVVAAEALKQIESNPSLKQRLINFAKEGGLAAFEKAIDNPIGAFIVNGIRGWNEVK
jgi:uncharacterized protein YjbI with pentapeptide repeats